MARRAGTNLGWEAHRVSDERTLGALLAGLSPRRRPGEYVFVVADTNKPVADGAIMASIVEAEGLSLLLRRRDADQAGLPYELVAGWITLEVRSALDAVGLWKVASATSSDIPIGASELPLSLGRRLQSASPGGPEGPTGPLAATRTVVAPSRPPHGPSARSPREHRGSPGPGPRARPSSPPHPPLRQDGGPRLRTGQWPPLRPCWPESSTIPPRRTWLARGTWPLRGLLRRPGSEPPGQPRPPGKTGRPSPSPPLSPAADGASRPTIRRCNPALGPPSPPLRRPASRPRRRGRQAGHPGSGTPAPRLPVSWPGRSPGRTSRASWRPGRRTTEAVPQSVVDADRCSRVGQPDMHVEGCFRSPGHEATEHLPYLEVAGFRHQLGVPRRAGGMDPAAHERGAGLPGRRPGPGQGGNGLTHRLRSPRPQLQLGSVQLMVHKFSTHGATGQDLVRHRCQAPGLRVDQQQLLLDPHGEPVAEIMAAAPIRASSPHGHRTVGQCEPPRPAPGPGSPRPPSAVPPRSWPPRHPRNPRRRGDRRSDGRSGSAQLSVRHHTKRPRLGLPAPPTRRGRPGGGAARSAPCPPVMP